MLAHVSQEPVLLDIYKNGGDVHSMTATGMYNMKHPDNPVTYEEFMLGRHLSDMFRDADGNIDSSKLSPAHVESLVAGGELEERFKDLELLTKWVALGYEFEKLRKSAKVVKLATNPSQNGEA